MQSKQKKKILVMDDDEKILAALPSWTVCLSISLLFAIGMFALAYVIANGRSRADLE